MDVFNREEGTLKNRMGHGGRVVTEGGKRRGGGALAFGARRFLHAVGKHLGGLLRHYVLLRFSLLVGRVESSCHMNALPYKC